MSSPDIVLIHGMWSCGEVAAPLAEHLEKRGYRVHTPTLPGHRPTSSTPVGRLSLNDYVDAICGLIGSKSFDRPPILVGHSMGGLIAQMVAARIEVGPLVLINSAGPAGINHICVSSFLATARTLINPLFWLLPHKPSWKEARYGLLNEVEESRAREIYERLVPESGKAVGELVFWFLDPTRTSRLPLPLPKNPMLLVSGGRDRITTPAVAQGLAALYPHAEVANYPENGHWIFEEKGRELVFTKIAAWIDHHSCSESELRGHHGVSSEDSRTSYGLSQLPQLPSPRVSSAQPSRHRAAMDRARRLRRGARGNAHEDAAAD